MAQLTKQITVKEDGGDILQNIVSDINEQFTEQEQTLLVQTMPGCADLFIVLDISQRRTELSRRDSTEIESSSAVGKGAASKLQYAIKRLLRIICTHVRGVVLFIDDLQWSDSPTLDLLKSLSLDVDLPSLLLVGAYRSDEVSE